MAHDAPSTPAPTVTKGFTYSMASALTPRLLLAFAMLACSACHPRMSPKDPSDLAPLLLRENLGSAEARPFLNLGTGVPLTFTERPGGAPARFGVASLGKDALSFDAEGFTLVLGEGSGAPVAHLRAEIVRSGPGVAPRGVEPSRSFEHRLVGSDPERWRVAVPTFSGLQYTAISDGIDVLYTIDSRALKSSYRVAAGSDPRQIRLRWPGLQSATADPITGRLELVIAAAGDRTRALTLLPPRATQGGETLPARYAAEGTTVGLVVDRHDPAAELRVDFGLAYGDVSHDYDARTSASGDVVVVRSVASADGSRLGANDILVARIDAGGRLLSTTIVGGTGDDVPHGLTVAADGKIYVTGTTSSRDFPLVKPLQREHRGSYDAFLLQLDPSGQRILASTYLGGSGDDVGEAIAVDLRGGAWVAGRGSLDCTAARGGRTSFATLFPRPVDGDPRVDYFLARMPTGLDRLLSVERFSAPRLRGPVAVWVSASGVPVVGVFSPLSVACNAGTDQTYQMSHYDDPADDGPTNLDAFDQDPYVNSAKPGNTLAPLQTGWGYHALRWKALGNPSITYDATVATGIPTSWVTCGHEGQLNAAETSAPVFASDPGGFWQCYQHTSLEGLGLAAAFYMHRFNSPVYTTQKTLNIDNNWQHYALGIEQVTFCAVGPGTIPQPLHALCNFDNIDPTTIQANCVYGSNAYYQLKDLKGRSWGKSALVYYAPSVVRVPDYGAPWYNKWYLPGDYVGDPPEDQALLVPYVADAVRQLAGRMLTERELEITIRPAIGPVRTATFTGLVRPFDLVRADNPAR